MTLQFQFVRRVRETEDVSSFYFEPSPEFAFAAGQYVVLTLPHTDVDDRGIERAFTIASSPADRLVRITTRLNRESSSFKRALLRLAPGATLGASGPYGNFVLPDDDTPSVFIAGGIGITPFRSMLGDLLTSGNRRQITLLYSNATPDFAFRRFLNELNTQWPEFQVVYTVTRASAGWEGPTGRIDAQFVWRYVPVPEAAMFYICGPTPLVDAMQRNLSELGVGSSRLVSEGFPGYEIHAPLPVN
jgi:ferredoxin-NADP reductase